MRMSCRVVVLSCLVLGCCRMDAQEGSTSRLISAERKPPVMSMAELPLTFEPNVGQGPSGEAYLARSGVMQVGFSVDSPTLRFTSASDHQGLGMTLVGATKTASIAASEKTGAQSNYLLGNQPSAWKTHIPQYGRLTYKDIYPGVDLTFYGTGGRVEHDFVVQPGSDYRQIRMRYSGARRLTLTSEGDLRVAIVDGDLIVRAPHIYQDAPGRRQERSGRFVLRGKDEVAFQVDAFDPALPLVIDPVLDYATYLSPLASEANLIATDATGNSYVSGYATLGYPVTPNAFSSCGGCTTDNVVTFISKLSADGTSLLYSTVLGGNSYTQPTGIAVDANGNTLLSGWTAATDFPTKSGQPIAPLNNGSVGFLVSLSADGSSLNYGTLLGSGPDSGFTPSSYAAAVALDSSGNAYITGTTGGGFVTTSGTLNQGGGGDSSNGDVFLAKFSPTGSLIYSAVLGNSDGQNGGAGPTGASAITVDAAGDAYVAGQAGTLWPISSNAYLNQIAGPMPYATPFVTKVAPDAKSLVYSTYLDYAYVVTGIAALPNGDVFVTGNSPGLSYPTTPNALSTEFG